MLISTTDCFFIPPAKYRVSRQAEEYVTDDTVDVVATIVDTAPAGVNFTDCVVNSDGHCCIDFVEEIESAVTNPVLECVTHFEKICHTSYVTNFVQKKGKVNDNQYKFLLSIIIVITRTVKMSLRRSVQLLSKRLSTMRL